MARKVVWTDGALDDLEEIAAYINHDSARNASRLVRRVLTASWSLDEMAERGRLVPELEDTGIRELIVGRHRLVYRLDEFSVEILAVVHGARDFMRLWVTDIRFR